MRCFWDGGCTRGLKAYIVPWANSEKDGRLLTEPVSTGLWSRYGKVIHAPEWWTAQLPPIQLDGELWMGRGSFQDVMSVVKRHDPGPEWKDVQFMVFDAPGTAIALQSGEIKNPNFNKKLLGCMEWFLATYSSDLTQRERLFREVEPYLRRYILPENNVCSIHEQIQLSFKTQEAMEQIDQLLETATSQGGEGLILRKPDSFWTPHRVNTLLKVKPYHDAEATVIGYVWGKGKFRGMMGAMICQYGDVRFELSGFTDQERHIMHNANMVCEDGKEVPENFTHPMFPVGSMISFKYRELTNAGIPKEARYYRKPN